MKIKSSIKTNREITSKAKHVPKPYAGALFIIICTTLVSRCSTSSAIHPRLTSAESAFKMPKPWSGSVRDTLARGGYTVTDQTA